MKRDRHCIGAGVYLDRATGGYWVRVKINKRRTWRKLKATREKEAFKEATNTDFENQSDGTFDELVDLYVAAQCPNKRLEPRLPEAMELEKTRLDSLREFFGKFRPDEIKMPLCLAFRDWRIRKVKRGSGERTVDMDLNTLSNVLNYGVVTGKLEFNFIRSGRPRFRRHDEVSHCRFKAPQDGTELNKLAEHFFSSPRGEVLGWLLLFGAFTGCRVSELLRLRLDAKTPDDAGFMSGNFLFIGRRSKRGVHPYSMIWPEMEPMIRCFLHWHQERFPNSPWFFPNRLCLTKELAQDIQIMCQTGASTRDVAKLFNVSQTQVCRVMNGEAIINNELTPCDATALTHGLEDACKALDLPKRTAHGLRSFYVTKRRSDGVLDSQIAAEIGDKTVDLIRTYGDRPANWSGGQKVTWLPAEGLPSWLIWDKPERKVVGL